MSDLNETQEVYDAKSQPETNKKFGETGKQAMQGQEVPPILSPEAQGKIVDIGQLPVEQRPQAVAEFFDTEAGKEAAKLAGGVDGKGVFFDDTEGHRFEIPYKEDKNEPAQKAEGKE
jgi:hypothetical protein